MSCNQDPFGYDWQSGDDTRISYYEVINLALNKLSTEGNYNEGDDYEIGEIMVELDESGKAYSWKIAIGTVNWYELEYSGAMLVSYSVIDKPDAIINGNNIVDSTTIVDTVNNEYANINYPLSVSLLEHSSYYDNPQWLSESIYIWDDNSIYKERYYDKKSDYDYIDYHYYPQMQYVDGIVSIETTNHEGEKSYKRFNFWDSEPTYNNFSYHYSYWWDCELFYDHESKGVSGTRIDDNSYSVDCSYSKRYIDYQGYYGYTVNGSETFTAEVVDTEYGAWGEGVIAVDAYTGEIVYCGPVIE
jgi:hypothetical protein